MWIKNKNFFDTSFGEDIIKKVFEINTNAMMAVEPTILAGYTERIANIMFLMEFLRDGQVLYDNLYFSKIIAGIPQRPRLGIWIQGRLLRE